VFGVRDFDAPAASTAYATWRTSAGRISKPWRVPNAQEVLDVSFDGETAELLTGDSEPGQSCCSNAGVVQLTSGGAFRRRQGLVAQLTGGTIGKLVALPGRMLAAIATARGVWVSQSGAGGRFAATHRLTAANASPEAMQAAALPKGGAIVAWTETRPSARLSGPGSIFVATGSQQKAPGGAHAPVNLSGGRTVNELGLAAASPATTLAWVESNFDRHGNYISDVAVMDLTRHGLVKRYDIPGTVASGLSFSSDAGGDQVLAWKTCTPAGACTLRAVVRAPGKRFSGPLPIAPIDADESPVAAVSPKGEALLGWIDAGHVLAAALPRAATRFSAMHVVSKTNYADNLALGFSRSGNAIATWSQGTLAPEIVGAFYNP
jgi:hypothetical protein